MSERRAKEEKTKKEFERNQKGKTIRNEKIKKSKTKKRKKEKERNANASSASSPQAVKDSTFPYPHKLSYVQSDND